MEIPFEFLLAGIESAHGTPNTTPTRYLNLSGVVTPRKARYRPNESRGTLAEYYRSTDVRKWSEFEAEGGLDVYTLPLLLNALIAGGIDGSGATPATLTTDLADDHNDLVYTAVTGGGQGNHISVQYIDPGADNSPLDVDVVDSAIKVYLATDGSGTITTTAGDISAAIAAHPVASTLVTVTNAASNNGTGVVTAMDTTYLSGGSGADVTTPDGATNSRLWTFVPTMDADDLDSLTLYWGDPNVQAFQADYCMLDELTITADAGGTDGVTMSISGQGRFPSKTAPGVVPSMLSAPLLMPSAMQLWIDTATIGTTEITGRVIGAEVTIPSGVTRKWLAAGPTGDLDFVTHGRAKRHAELKLTLEVPDLTQYNQWVAATVLKTRVRFNGPLIEAGFHHYVEFDIYGPMDGFEWGEFEGSNRTVELTILSEYDSSAGYDFAVKVQNDRDAL